MGNKTTSSTMSLRCMLMPSSRASYQQQRDRSRMLHGGSCMEYTTYFPQARTMPRPHLSKKLHKGEGTFETTKCLLGFDFDGVNKTIRLEEDKRVSPPNDPPPVHPRHNKGETGHILTEFRSVTATWDTPSWHSRRVAGYSACATGLYRSDYR